MNAKVALTYCNFNANIFILRDKISQDLALKSSLYQIHNRPCKQVGSFSFITQHKSLSSTSTSMPIRYSLTKRSRDPFNARVKALKHTILSAKKHCNRLQTEAIQKDNNIFQQRLNRISSPYSKHKLNQSAPKIEYYKSICRKIKPYKESLKRNNNILYKLSQISRRNWP